MKAQLPLLYFAFLALLAGCASPRLLTPDEMREAVIGDRRDAVVGSLKAGFSPTQEVAYCFPLLPFAAAMKRNAIVQGLIDESGRAEELLASANCMGHTALHFTALTGNEELMKFLIERGANRAAQDGSGKVPDDLVLKSVTNP